MSDNPEKKQLEYHYSREDRLNLLPPGIIKEKSGKKGFFRNNKPLGIILADIVIISILFFGYFIYTKTISNQNSNPDFSFLLNGYIFDNNLLISLTISKKENSRLPESAAFPLEAAITISGNDSFYKKFFDTMPDKPDNDTILRTSIHAADYAINKNSIIYATIEYNNKTIELKSRLKSENKI